MYFMRPALDVFGLMGNTVKLPFLTAGGLNTDIVFGVEGVLFLVEILGGSVSLSSCCFVLHDGFNTQGFEQCPSQFE